MAAPPLLMEDFGQKVDICSRIREILDNYPPGTTVLKEYVQNADDAGAAKIVFCLDMRSYGTQSLASGALASFQGPALLVYNDAVFSDTDFESIQNIGDSQKKQALVKTGRFGIGFNSCYHITELPTFLSRNRLVMFDPQAKYLPDVNPANPGKSIDVLSKTVQAHYADQLEPYKVFGADLASEYRATLFRLPLRTAEQAKLSRLSNQTHTVESVLPLLREFIGDAQHSLLFLKSVSAIETCVWQQGQAAPTPLWTCRLANASKQLSALRARIPASVLQTQTQAAKSKALTFEAVESDYSLEVAVTEHAPTGVAALVSVDGGAAPAVAGRSFCFLPLPAETGLPVHVNGYFELSSNRRDIWRGDDMVGDGRTRAEWNKALLEDVVAPTYARMLLRLCKGGAEQVGGVGSYYGLWPVGRFQEPWGGLVRRVYEETGGLCVLWSDVGGGRWVAPEEAKYVGEDQELGNDVAAALLEDGEAVVRVPSGIAEGYAAVHSPLLGVTPGWLRQHYKGRPKSRSLSVLRERAVRLLRFCLQDLDPESRRGSPGWDAYACLVGLPLVPVAAGGLQTFGGPGGGGAKGALLVGGELECAVLLELRARIVDGELPLGVLAHFNSAALQAATNVVALSPPIVAECLADVLPAKWRAVTEVQWLPGQVGHPSEEWVTCLWRFLGTCEDLDVFGEWPLLPTSDGTLCRMSDSSSKVVDGVEALSQRLQEILSILGCRMLDTAHIHAHRPEALARFVQRPTLRGVLAALWHASGGSFEAIVSNMEDLPPTDRREVRGFFMQRRWMCEEECRQQERPFVLGLPVHEAHGEGGGFMAVDEGKRLPPAGAPVELLTSSYVRLQAEGEEGMYRFLGVPAAQLSDFYTQAVFPRLHELGGEVCEGSMVGMLEQLPQLMKMDPNFMQTLARVAFVTTGAGKLARARDLYDPNVRELHDLLEGGEFYPSEAFHRPELVATLIRLGLRTSLDRSGVVRVAHSVSSMDVSDVEATKSRASALLRFLDNHYGDLVREASAITAAASRAASGMKQLMGTFISNKPPPPPRPERREPPAHVTGNAKGDMSVEAFRSELLQLAWVPVLTEPPVEGLPWTDGRSPLACPSDARPREEMWLLSFFVGIVDGDVKSPELRALFGWGRPADPTLIAAQLVKLTQIEGVGGSAEVQEALNAAVFRIYSAFQQALGTAEFDEVQQILAGHSWVWMGDGFAPPHTVAFKCALNARPMLSAVPAEISSFARLLRALGVREAFCGQDYIRSLGALAAAHGVAALPATQLELAVAMVQYVADDAGAIDAGQNKMLVPDGEAVMRHAEELVYNDAPWMPASAFSADDFCFVHPKISIDVGEKVGVRSLRRQLLLKNSDLIDIGLQDAEAFGQSESLTGRLRHILELYPDGPGIVNELIQNADDARASEVSILINRKSYATSSLLSPQMASWQGPAIYFHNNAVFRPADFTNLSRIGQGSKLDCLGKTGKFGLGFNAVYHFTDLPSFVSGEYLVYFDPHTTFLPGATLQHPGLKIRFTRNNIASQFPDQMQPYLLMGCDLQSEYKGTMFRFPLRSPAVAKQSEVKKDPYSLPELTDLIDNFRRAAPETLLFLKNIRSIKIFDLADGDEAPRLVHHVSARAEPVEDAARFFTIPQFVEGPASAPITKDQFFQVLRKTPAERLPHVEMIVCITEAAGGGGVTHSSRWAISSAIGGGLAKEIAVHPKTAHLRLVPWAGVAALLSREAGGDAEVEALALKGRSFCFLPLPAETGLPVHVNGYFELSSNRRDIWRGDDMAGDGRIRAEWNKALLEDVVAPTYARMLLRLCRSYGAKELEAYYRVWPGESNGEPWASLVRRVYGESRKMPVLFSEVGGGKWVSPEEARYVSSEWEFHEDVAAVLLECGQAAVRVPDKLRSGFADVDGCLVHADAKFMRGFLSGLKSLPDCVAKDGPRAVRLLQYCLGDLILGCPADTDGGEAYTCLVGLPLVPVANGTLQVFGKKSDQVPLYVGTGVECELLAAMRGRLVDVNLPAAVLDHFRSEALQAYTNVRGLTPEMVAECLAAVLPHKWKGVDEVQWLPGESGHPTEAWLGLLWQYLISSEGLAHFCQWPLLPTCDGTLCRLMEGRSKVIDGASVLGERLRVLLSRLGCRMLDADRVGKKEALGTYVQRPTLRGVLAALAHGNRDDWERIGVVLSGASAADKRELRAFFSQRRWLNEDGCSREEAQMLLALPIHEGHGAQEAFQGVAEAGRLPPPGAPQELLTAEFVRCEGEGEADMYRFLGVPTAQLTDFYTRSVLPRLKDLGPVGGEQASLTMLQQLPQLCREDPRFWDKLANVPFVTTAQGNLARPWELYDPSVPQLQGLLEGGDFYPASAFLRPELVATLIRLGLQTSLDRGGIMRVARSISQRALAEGGREDAGLARRGRALLTYLDKHAKALGIGHAGEGEEEQDAAWRKELCSLSWVPVLREAPRPSLPWNKASRHVAPPRACRTAEEAPLVSAALGICAVPLRSDALVAYLGWADPVPPLVIAQQLLQYARMFPADSTLPALEQPTSSMGPIPGEVREAVLHLYDVLAMHTLAEGFEAVRAALRGQRCLLLDSDEFVEPERCALESEADLAPFLHGFPEGLVGYEALFRELGARARFSARDLVTCLVRLRSACGEGALEPEQLVLAGRLAREAAQHALGAEERGLLCLPDTEGVMCAAEDLVYDDAAWLSSTLQGVRFLHADIPNEVAAALGLGSVRKLLLAGRVNVKDLTCPRPAQLSRQLQRCGGAGRVLANLLDCADCLGARGVHFLVDFRTHPSQSILQPNLASLQGPALVVHMEGVELGAEQLCRLQNLPPAQHGLRRTPRASPGLCSAYAVTDVPCIISGEGMFFFDPKGTHFVDGAHDRPTPVGKAHLFVNSEMPMRFPDQFRPFEVFGFSPSQRFAGTILRMPLRGCDEALVGEGQGERYDAPVGVEHLEELLADLGGAGVGPEALLFLECVENVTVSAWREDADKMALAFRTFVQPPVSPGLRQMRGAMSSNKEWHKFNLLSMFGTCPPIRQSMRINIITYDAARDSTAQERWLVCSSLGTRTARKMALDNKASQWVPLCAVAALLQRGETIMPELDGGLFAYSPLQASGLPVHVHAWFECDGAELSWKREPDEGEGGEGEEVVVPSAVGGDEAALLWNRELVACVVEAYLDLLRAMPEVLKNDVSSMYRIWPTSPQAVPFLHDALLKPLYSLLAKEQLFLLGNMQLTKMQGGVFKPTEASESLRQLFRGMFPMFACPSALVEEFKRAGVSDVSEITPERVRRKLKKEPRIVDSCLASFTGVRQAELVPFVTDALEYTLLGLSARGAATYRDLHQIKLLPMASGHVLCFPFEAFVASEEEQRLMPMLRDSFVHPLCSDKLQSWFSSPEFLQALSLRRFTPAVLSANLGNVLPKHWRNQRVVPAYSSGGDAAGLPSPEWLRRLWAFVGPDNMHLLTQWPVVPLASGALASVAAMGEVLNLPLALPPPPPEGEGSPLELFAFEGVGGEDPIVAEHCDFLRSHPVATAARRLGCPVVHPAFGGFVPRADPDALASAVLTVLSNAPPAGGAAAAVSAEESRALFAFIAEHHERAAQPYSPQQLAALRKLPIFETRGGSFVALTGEDPYYICPPHMAAPTESASLLKHQCAGLYLELGVQELDETALFERFVLPNFGTMPQERQLEAIQHVRRNWGEVQQRPALLEKLRSLQFVETHGMLLRPDQLFDPKRSIFQSVFENDPVFPTGDFASDEWLPVLRALGLQSQVSADVFVQCARRVQRSYAQAVAEGDEEKKGKALAVASGLSSHLIENFSTLNSPNFCSEIAQIPFVPVDLPTTSAGGGGEALMRFCDACVPKDRLLVWTVMSVLKPSLKVNDFMLERLKIQSPPPPATVVANLRGITADTLIRWPLEEHVTTVFQKIFDFLWDRWRDVAAEDQVALRGMACIPVRGELVRPSRVFFRVHGDYAPFMFELPRAFGAQEALLRELGVREAPSTQDLTSFIGEVGAECVGHPLNPNELSAVVRVLESLTSQGHTSDPSRPLLVPDVQGLLVPAHRCFLCDDGALLQRLDPSAVHLSSSALSAEVCASVGVRALSVALEERLDEAGGDLLYVHGQGEDDLTERLTSHEFASVIEHLCGGGGVSAASAHAFLGGFRVRVARDLKTRLLLPTGEDVTGVGGDRVMFFVDQAKKRVLLSHELPPSVEFHHALAAAVNKVFEGKLSRDLLPLSVALASPLFSMLASLGVMGLRPHGVGLGGAAGRRGVPGAVVEGGDEELLCVQPMHRFWQGEVVAVQDDAGVLRYATVVEAGAAGDAVSEDAVVVRRLVLRTGPKATGTFLSTSVYCFRPTAHKRGGAGAGGGGAAHAPLEAPPVIQIGGVAVGGDDGAGGSGGAGAVTAGELAGAVTDILKRLKVPISLEKTEIVEQLVSTRAELGEAKSRMSVMKKTSDIAEKQQNRLRELCTCPITHELMVDPVCASDGHVYERSSIERCIQDGAPSPLTRRELTNVLVPSHAHKALCRLLREQR